MSASASTGSPTLRRSMAGRSTSQENASASSDKLTGRIVSHHIFTIQSILKTSPSSYCRHKSSLQPTPTSITSLTLLHPQHLPTSSSFFRVHIFEFNTITSNLLHLTGNFHYLGRCHVPQERCYGLVFFQARKSSSQGQSSHNFATLRFLLAISNSYRR